MSINVHIYPSQMTNESRILKIVKSIEKMDLFSRIYLLGINQSSKLQTEELVSEKIAIFRININSAKWEKTKFVGKKIIPVIKFWILSYRFFLKIKPSIINAHNLASLPPCVIYKIFYRSKIIYDTHELETERQGWGKFEKYLSKFFEYICYFFIDKTIVVSKPIGEFYSKKYNINPIVIHNCPSFTKPLTSNYFRKKFKIKSNTKTFLYIGALTKNRGIEEYLECFQKTKLNIALIFLGGGELKNLIQKYAIKNTNIFFHSSVKPSEVVNIAASADYALPIMKTGKASLSYEYMMPNKLFESIMANVPMISGGFYYETAFIEKNKIGQKMLFNNQTPLVEKAIINILNKNYINMQENCKRLSKTFNWENEDKKIKSYMNELTSKVK